MLAPAGYVSLGVSGSGVRIFRDHEKQVWWVWNDLCIELGTNRALSGYYRKKMPKEHWMHYPVVPGVGPMLLITREAAERCIMSSRSPLAPLAARTLGLKVQKNIVDEVQHLESIVLSFKDKDCRRQYNPPGTRYRVDLYFPTYRIAVECDELGHATRNLRYEEARQARIEETLACKFIRFNPHEQDFNVGNVVHAIRMEIESPKKRDCP